jgi:hypothetical protein
MSTRYPEQHSGDRARGSLLSLLVLALLGFVAGLAVMVWLLAQWPAAGELLGVKTPPTAPAPLALVAPPAPPTIIQAPTPSTTAEVELNQRLGALEQKVGAIDSQAREAVGDAGRAENLLIAFAARRALDRGVGLGYLEALLRERFGTNQPQAVATIIAASNRPVTLQELQQQLQELGPQLVEGSPKQSWWGAFRQELSDLVTIRHSNSPSTMPSERLERAEQRLETGQVSIALAELNRLPGRDKAANWFAAARRYIAARDALDRIETAALLEQKPQPVSAAGGEAPAPQ